MHVALKISKNNNDKNNKKEIERNCINDVTKIFPKPFI